ncbi:hypothetical protein D3C80_1962630 [compost metagenome]
MRLVGFFIDNRIPAKKHGHRWMASFVKLRETHIAIIPMAYARKVFLNPIKRSERVENIFIINDANISYEGRERFRRKKCKAP